MRVVRKIIRIDEALCNGCGQCVTGCAEGALRIVDGKARLVGEIFCDGLGACLGECPTGALTLEEREAEEFDEAAVEDLLAKGKGQGGCPSAGLATMTPCQQANVPSDIQGTQQSAGSALAHWPVQIRLIPPHAPFLKDADLLITADCAGASYPALHADFLPGKVLMLGCPKFDDAEMYVRHFADIFRAQPPKSATVLEMEVPCCSGLHKIVLAGARQAGLDLAVERVRISRDGKVLDQETVRAGELG